MVKGGLWGRGLQGEGVTGEGVIGGGDNMWGGWLWGEGIMGGFGHSTSLRFSYCKILCINCKLFFPFSSFLPPGNSTSVLTLISRSFMLPPSHLPGSDPKGTVLSILSLIKLGTVCATLKGMAFK